MTAGEGRGARTARDALAVIGQRARRSNTVRADRLQRAVDALVSGGLSDPERAEAVAVAHQLVGSAGTFGFPHASDLASELERFFADADAEFDQQDQQARLAAAQLLVRDLRSELAAEPTDG